VILPHGLRVILCLTPTDMRCGYDSLAGRVKAVLDDDPLGGALFVFRSRDATRLKILYWDKDGLAIWMKRLEKGTFRFPRHDAGTKIAIPAADLAMLLDGVDLASVKRRKRFVLGPQSGALQAPLETKKS